MRPLFFFLLCCCLTSTAIARNGATGCLILSEEKIYTSLGSKGIYNNTPVVSVSAAYCDWTPTTGAACNVCSVALNGGGNCGGTLKPGVSGTFVEMCPVDDWVGYLVVLAGALGFLMLRPFRSNLINT